MPCIAFLRARHQRPRFDDDLLELSCRQRSPRRRLSPMKIIHLSSDLMMGSQLSQAARGRGLAVEMIQRLEQLAERIDAETRLVAIDLQSPGWSAESFAAGRSLYAPAIPIVAYAQHVFPELLSAAERAGITTVLTRGQFARSLGEILDQALPGD